MRLAIALFFASLILTPASPAGTLFLDDFNRADGAVDNGWTTFGAGATIVSGQLQTVGASAVGGGIFRTLSVTFPLTFSFDFSTADPSDGGWFIALNAVSTLVPGPDPGQVSYDQYRGSDSIIRRTPSAFEFSPDLPWPMDGWQDFGVAPAHVYGLVNEDLSAMISITYADGTQVSGAFGPQVSGPVGSLLVIGNSNASIGPDFIDNVQITTVPEPTSLLLLGTGLAGIGLAAWRRKKV